MECQIKVEIEHDGYEEPEIDFDLVGGYDTSSTPVNDPLELKVENVKVESKALFDEYKSQDDIISTNGAYQITSELNIKNEQIFLEERKEINADVADMIDDYNTESNEDVLNKRNNRIEMVNADVLKRAVDCNTFKQIGFDNCTKEFANNLIRWWENTRTGINSLDNTENDKCSTQNNSVTIIRSKTRYPCEECGKSFSQLNNLRTHLRLHTGEKPFKCEECGKSFSRLSSLQMHIRVHTGERPFKCEECGKSYPHLSSLRDHIPIHTGEKPYECKECFKTFSRSSNLRTHMRYHSKEKAFQCEECSKSFRQSSELTRHLRVHTGEKPFKCEKCSKCFSTIGNLRNHERTHTGQKPFKCQECDKSFSYSRSLKLHKSFSHSRSLKLPTYTRTEEAILTEQNTLN